MSGIEKQPTNDDDVDEEEPTKGEEEGDGKRCKGCGKKVPFFRLRKGKKLQHRKKKKKGFLVNSGSWAGCCFCLKRSQAVDSSGESPTSDPNSSEFAFDMLRALIENNDFWSEDCNPHLDTDRC